VERIVLIGFMGSGKSTLGPLLASRLEVPFVDLDAEIERRVACSIAELVERDGEPVFRRYELDVLQALGTEAPRPAVVATGGGIVELPNALQHLRALGQVVWLRADPEVSVGRLDATARAARPLLDPAGSWRRRWERREPLYRACADVVVGTHPETVGESLEQLLRLAHGPSA
jgi:shikimate kinase